MKFCPNCGVELSDTNATQCSGCGESLAPFAHERKPQKSKAFRKHQAKREKPKKGKRPSMHSNEETIQEVMGEAVDDGYDGYYDDVLPPDLDRSSEGMDTALMKKIALLIIGVILVIGACVVMMYTL